MATDGENLVMPTIPAEIATNSITIDPTKIHINSAFKPFATFATEEMVNTAVEKLDQHVDQLEEDIDYFNNKLQQIDAYAQTSLDRADAFEIKMNKLESTVEYLKNYINYLEQAHCKIGSKSR